METKSVYIILVIVLLGAMGVAAIWFFQCSSGACLIFEWQKNRIIDSFEKCAAAGKPIMESYPRQCRAGGKSFTESLQPVGNDNIEVSMPLSGALVQSPLKIIGRARGTWYFEASFPVRLIDGHGQELAVIPAQAQGDWMTTEFVPFEALLVFSPPQTAAGTLILEKDNPSGLPEFDDSISVPVQFK